MTKSSIFLLSFLASIFFNSALGQGKNDIIVEYRPVQSGIVGKTVATYSNGQALFGNFIPDLTTKDEPSSAEQTEEYNKRLSFGLSTILKGESTKDFTIHSYNPKVMNVTNDVQKIPTGSRIVMTGLKADSVTITFVKKSGYKLSLSQLLEKIKPFAPVAAGSPVNLLSLVDSVNYNNNKSITVVIRNPEVIYSIIVGQIEKEFASNAYLDFSAAIQTKSLSANAQTNFVLPRHSKTFDKIGRPRRFALRTKPGPAGTIELYIVSTNPDGGEEEKPVPKVGDRYSATNMVFKSIVPGKITKEYAVDVSAIAEGSNITIQSAEIRYPEWVFNAVKRKNL